MEKDLLTIPMVYQDALSELFTNVEDALTDDDKKNVQNVFAKALQHATVQKDGFGLDPLEMDVLTAMVYVKDIGVNRTSILSILMKFFFSNEWISSTDIQKLFGDDVLQILRGLAKVSKLYDKNQAVATENFRDLLMLFAQDMRVIFIIIADRVNMMRRIKDKGADDERRKIAEEASALYAPLAHKLGLYLIKSELEDLSMKYLETEVYYQIKEDLNATKKTRDLYVEHFIRPIEEKLQQAGLKFHIKGRTKSIHSIWQKMKKQKCAFKDIYDLFAIRIILDSDLKKEKEECWRVYSIVTDMYVPNTKRLRDWLSVPKSNGYESLHITVMGPEGKWVEVQIRTERMDVIAERGVAAHWRYKGVKDSGSKMEEWLQEMRMSLELNDNNSYEIENQFKVNIYDEDVFVFTPKGDLFKLSEGATLLDFAYLIHTDVGAHCSGGKINGKNATLKTKLHSGDQVEVFTNPKQLPKRDWLAFVKTTKARVKIKQQLNEQEQKSATFAREMLERKFKNKKVVYEEAVLMKLVKRMGYKQIMDFYRAIAEEVLDVNEFIEKYVEAVKRNNGEPTDNQPLHSADQYVQADDGLEGKYKDMLVIDKNVKGVDYALAKCCSPIYGDKIFGFVTAGRGIKIHRTDCPNAARLRDLMAYRIIPAQWAGKGNSMYAVTLSVVGHDDIGIVNNITSIINKENNVLLRSINIKSAEDGLFSGTLTIQIDDNNKLKQLIKKLKGVKGVKDVIR